jgi:hypothetical protein
MITLHTKTIYGKCVLGSGVSAYWKFKKGSQSCTYIAFKALSLNYDVPLNTYKNEAAMLIKKQEWDEQLKAFKSEMKTI